MPPSMKAWEVMYLITLFPAQRVILHSKSLVVIFKLYFLANKGIPIKAL